MIPPSIPDSAQRIVTSLASEAKIPVEEVAQLYEEKHAELDREARVKSFLPIFAIRSVKDVLRRRGGGGAPEQSKSHSYGAWVGGEVTA